MSTIQQTLARGSISFSRPQYWRRKFTNRLMLSITGIMTLIALVPLFWIIGYVIYKGGQYISLDLFTQMPRPLGVQGGGVLHAIQGTLLLSVLAGIFSIPPGILAAFFAARFPNTPIGIAVRFGTDVMSGVPSIVVGMFAYALIVKVQGHFSALAGGFALALIMLPTVIRTTEEMIKLVPQSLREASLALGAAEWKTSISVILPAAANGIVTGIILGLARASGETAPLLFTALGNERFDAVAIVTNGINAKQSLWVILQRLLGQPVDSLPLTLWKYAQQPFPERINQSWAVAFVLMLLILTLNIVARLWVHFRSTKIRG